MKIQQNLTKSLEICEMIPVVSTITSVASIALKSSVNPQNASPLATYLSSRSYVYLALNAIPLVNIIIYIVSKTLCPSLVTAPFQQVAQPVIARPSILPPPPMPQPIPPMPQPLVLPKPSPKTSGRSTPEELHAAYAAIGDARPRAAGAKQGNLFKSDDILVKYDYSEIVFPYEEDDKLAVYKFNELHILFQESLQGCSAGSAGMLALDHGKKVPYADLKSRKADDYQRIRLDITNAGLTPKVTSLPTLSEVGVAAKLSAARLDDCLKAHGPACVRIQSPDDKSIKHWIVVDEVDLVKQTVALRDPWHGERLEITLKTFQAWWQAAWTTCQAEAPYFVDHIVQVQK